MSAGLSQAQTCNDDTERNRGALGRHRDRDWCEWSHVLRRPQRYLDPPRRPLSADPAHGYTSFIHTKHGEVYGTHFEQFAITYGPLIMIGILFVGGVFSFKFFYLEHDAEKWDRFSENIMLHQKARAGGRLEEKSSRSREAATKLSTRLYRRGDRDDRLRCAVDGRALTPPDFQSLLNTTDASQPVSSARAAVASP